MVAGAATFAAFPGWYATMFSSLYLALLLILLALMVRGVSFEFRDKVTDPRWGRTWTLGHGRWQRAGAAAASGSGSATCCTACRSTQSHDFTGNFFDLLTPYGLWTGVTLVAVSLLHGATFLTLKTNGRGAGARTAGGPSAVVAGDRRGARRS